MLDRADLYSSEHGIGGIRGTKDALKWVFEAKAGEVSGLYECGESDHMLVVGVASIVPEGYRPLALVKDQLRAEILRDKKAEKIMADMKAANATSFEQYNVKTTESINASAAGISGYRQFEYPFIARAEGTYEVEPVEFSYFDPARMQYMTLRSRPLELEITPEIGRASCRERV